uniref:Uncharacterized protein n=1 Tax=Vitrella brassicaformis TaxID=1169539 RepID=A0A6U4B4H2_9ALVE|mmetsp:Transcript_14820/g.35333  ORF Transcript_14820/g.35333 Transcript_14820/m.35333 type:complete len:119 (+) Transcript_14820:193-549(+)
MARFLRFSPTSLRILVPAAATKAQSLLPGIGWRRSDDATPWLCQPMAFVSIPREQLARCMRQACNESAGEDEEIERPRQQEWSQMMHEKKEEKRRDEHTFRAVKELRASREGVIKKTT